MRRGRGRTGEGRECGAGEENCTVSAAVGTTGPPPEATPGPAPPRWGLTPRCLTRTTRLSCLKRFASDAAQDVPLSLLSRRSRGEDPLASTRRPSPPPDRRRPTPDPRTPPGPRRESHGAPVAPHDLRLRARPRPSQLTTRTVGEWVKRDGPGPRAGGGRGDLIHLSTPFATKLVERVVGGGGGPGGWRWVQVVAETREPE